jgi:hypothetical protein
LLVDTGDRVEGNGLYEGSTPPGRFTGDLLAAQDIDILSIGNHELYKATTAEREYNTTVPSFKGNYISSNVDIIDPKSGKRVQMAPRFRKFKTKNQGIRILAFGFLFDFKGNANNSFVQPVEETIKETWFQDAIHDRDVDLIVVAGHVAIRGPEYSAIYKAIRSVQWDTPIQFFGGHLHIRDYVVFDSKSTALASGRFMETIGFLSIDGLGSVGNKSAIAKAKSKATSTSTSLSFNRIYLDNNLFSYQHHSKKNETEFPTKEGRKVSEKITQIRKDLDLDSSYGCAPDNLWLNRAPYPGNNSILSWLDEHVLPEMVINKDRSDQARMIIVNSGGVRFDLFAGPFTRDGVFIICPFTSHFNYIPDVPFDKANRIIDLLNHGPTPFGSLTSDDFLAGNLEELLDLSHLGPSMQRGELKRRNRKREQLSPARNHGQEALLNKDDPSVPLIPGYTTQDDAGSDGDDTVHSPITFHNVPNCIQAVAGYPKSSDPKTVDVVFFDFIQPYILLALTFLGAEYKDADVKPYLGDDTMGSLMVEWAQKNWDMTCKGV